VLGFDISEVNLYHFEKEKGIATNIDNVFENADIVVFVSDCCSNEDFYKLGKGQIVLINPAINFDTLVFQERGIKGYELLNTENSYLLLPGLAEKMVRGQMHTFNNELLISIGKALYSANIDVDSAENMYSITETIQKV
jgi:hypothetical protein